MQGNDKVKFWFLVLGLAVATLYSFIYCFLSWRKNRVVEDTPTSRVRSAAQGYVEFTGQGRLPPNTDNKAPLSGIPCAWWHYKIEQRSGGRSRSWTTIDSGTSTVPFILDDGTGQCLIDPHGAEVFPSANDVWFGSEEWPGVCIPSGGGLGGWFSNVFSNAFSGGGYRYTEQRLTFPGELYAIGSFRTLSGLSVQTPEQATVELLRGWKADQKSLLDRFDTNHDGSLSADEWDQARAAARRQATEELGAAPQDPDMSVLAKPTDGRAFLLAAGTEDLLARRLRRRAVAGMAAFVGSSCALTWVVTRV